LLRLRASGRIPRDSFIADGSNFRQQFWPVGAVTLPAPLLLPEAQIEETAAPAPLLPTEESVAEARDGERLLSQAEREEIQRALQWNGVYSGGIDGAIGPGTRTAMAAWQDANRFEPTGVLTTAQRRDLVTSYRDVLNSVGLARVLDAKAGIELDLPMAMVEFERYDPPFVHYRAKGDSGVRVLLISQTGDQATLAGLYDIMQTLEIVPLSGPRELGKSSFTLEGSNAEISSYTYAAQADGRVKGFTILWPAGNDRRRDMAIGAMQASFRPTSDAVLPDVMDGGTTQSRDLLSGLDIRQAERVRSGFYVDGAGSVLTAVEAVEGCGRVTLDDEFEAEVVARNDTLGLALLRPREPLVPIAFARFQPHEPRLDSEIAVSGYSYEGQLGAPTLTYGTLQDVKGLNGEASLTRLALTATTGDAGGPVFDSTGSVMGMLLPPLRTGGRVLPEDVSFAADAVAIVEFLSANGIAAAASDATSGMAPEDLTTSAADMTVEVSCWN
jgi:peptidoglycan hydrolase-like protein with peptidoglycan-binding domain